MAALLLLATLYLQGSFIRVIGILIYWFVRLLLASLGRIQRNFRHLIWSSIVTLLRALYAIGHLSTKATGVVLRVALLIAVFISAFSSHIRVSSISKRPTSRPSPTTLQQSYPAVSVGSSQVHDTALLEDVTASWNIGSIGRTLVECTSLRDWPHARDLQWP